MANFTLQLLHVSDQEGSTLTPTTAPILGALIDRFDDQYANTLVLSSGDNFIPGPFLTAGADPSVSEAIGGTTGLGRPDIAILNALGVDASAIGNHEWDLGSSVLAGAYASASGWAGAQFPYLSANLDFSADSAIRGTVVDGGQEASSIAGKVAPSAIVTMGGEKIGLVGATTQLLERISSPTGTEVNGYPKAGQPGDGTTEVDNMDLLAAELQPVIDGLIAQGANKIVLQSHLQLIANELSLAGKLRGVDVILAGGSNTRMGDSTDVAGTFPGHDPDFELTYPQTRTDLDGKTTLVVSVDGESTYLGRLVLEFDEAGNIVPGSLDPAINGAYASDQATLEAAYGADIGQAFAAGSIGADVRTITDAVANVIAEKDGNVYGFTDVYLEGDRVFGRSQETNLGNLTADANIAALQAIDPDVLVVSLKNGGGIRASIGSVDPATGTKLPPAANPDAGKDEGGVSQLDTENALRFDNKLMAFDTTAQGLLNILNYAAGLAPGNGGFPQLGGVRFSYDPDLPAGQRVQNVAVYDENDELQAVLVNDGRVVGGAPETITVVTLNFTANGGDGYPVKENGENFRYLLEDGTFGAAIDESIDFTTVAPENALGEQQAFADYMSQRHGTQEDAFDIADTPASHDLRIENLNARADAVFQGAFGEIARDTSSDAGMVFNLYDSFLERAPDRAGAAGWAEAIEGGESLESIVSRFLGSQEYTTRHGDPDTLSNDAFVDQLYRVVLERAPDAAGKAGWVSFLDGGGSRSDLATRFATSGENLAQTDAKLTQGFFVADQDTLDAARYYHVLLDRAPDAPGLAGFAGRIDAGLSQVEAASLVLGSEEYDRKYGALSDGEFVGMLYENALGRAPDAVGGAGWVGALDNGDLTRAEVAARFVNGAEARLFLAPVVDTGFELI